MGEVYGRGWRIAWVLRWKGDVGLDIRCRRGLDYGAGRVLRGVSDKKINDGRKKNINKNCTGIPDKVECVVTREGMERLQEMRRKPGKMSAEEYERGK